MIQRAKIDTKAKEILREEIDRALFDLAAGDGINLAEPKSTAGPSAKKEKSE